MSKMIFALSLFILSAFSYAAAAAAPAPNLEVQAWQGSATPLVESPYQYTARVKNTGNQTANGVFLTIEFPLTNTSPSKYILGKLSGLQTGCSIVSNKLRCDVGSIGNNQTKLITFTFEFQVASTAPTLKATATTSSTNEVNVNNNSLSFTPTLRYPDNVVTGGSYLVTSCSGTGLTSFYECELFPSSQQNFGVDLNLGGTVGVPQAPTYIGFWDQSALPQNKTLHFTLDGGGGTEVEFRGYAISSTCFEGITIFPGSTSNAAYRVCEQ